MKVAALFVSKSRLVTVAQALSSDGVEVLPSVSIGGLMQILRQSGVDAVLLEDSASDLVDWLAMLQMRVAGSLPIIVLGGAGGFGMAEALAHGATDYAEFVDSPAPLLARLRARVSSRGTQARQGLGVGPFSLNASRSVVCCEGVEVSLTAREFALAWVLFANAGRVVSIASLSARVWGRSQEICKRTLEQHVYKLRRKLSQGLPPDRLRINAVYGVGYRLDVLAATRGWDSAFASDTMPMSLDTMPAPLDSLPMPLDTMPAPLDAMRAPLRTMFSDDSWLPNSMWGDH